VFYIKLPCIQYFSGYGDVLVLCCAGQKSNLSRAIEVAHSDGQIVLFFVAFVYGSVIKGRG